jgi:2-methylcitrate dehydratase PrpD
MSSAFGLALMQTAGSMQIVYGGDPPAKAIYGAFPNFAGVLAAELAAEGLGADCEALDGQAGLFQAFFGKAGMPSDSLDGLGEKFMVERVGFKPWPTSGNCHPFIEAALKLYADGVRAEQIDKIVIAGHERARAWCEPAAERRAPANGASAANAVPFCVAKAFLNGAVTLADFTPAGIADAAMRHVADLIEHELGGEPMGTARVRVFLRDGTEREAHVTAALGTPDNPMNRDQIVQKFLTCASYALKPLDAARCQSIVDAVDTIEDFDDMRNFSALLS